MFDVNMYATTKELKLKTGSHTFERFDQNVQQCITLTLSTGLTEGSVRLNMSPEQAEQMAHALLSQLQQIQEKESKQND